MENRKDFLRLVVDRELNNSPIRGVYLVTDEGIRLAERVKVAINSGVSVVQYRKKTGEPGEKLSIGLQLKKQCAEAGVTFLVNDDLALAKALDADGLHLGQDDGSPLEARRELGPRKIIGVSTHNMEEALKAQSDGADYIGLGAMFPTDSKEISHLAGPEALPAIKERVKLPVVAIGGINRDNGSQIVDNGADALAVISAILGHREPGLAAAELALLFNRRAQFPRGNVLTIAGSDSGGGAGIQADLKTITLLGSYGASAMTALTAQNTRGVAAIHGVPAEFLAQQLDSVLSDIHVDVVKTGMLFSADNIGIIADKLQQYGKKIIIIDPVMLAKGGAELIDREALAIFKKRLLPCAYLLTPNIPEAEKLTGFTVSCEDDMQRAAKTLHQMGARNVLVKGGHLAEGTAVDILFDGKNFSQFPVPRILTKNTHGTGCTLASAISTFLAQGEPLPQAVARAKEFITAAIKLAHPLGKGHGPVNHYMAAQKVRCQQGVPCQE
ncbi:4-amino-5-hydroxymethyl-2-methylpyrimidine-phosphate kinase and thiamin-monophosphate synthase [Geotalea daltonii FRC-32]|uniref:Thiamine-phosphate synthase n=1 Tax=Geotalea daltonii (strain DSM 22248 / JCM 15807 / FRC-32) TaxID=316067 RepID=B9M4Q2_GEODF|nr:bifunctional hydroxymethylpyrimidine kinase/phosphomethylpyrimidine kinase [Geotalea daltonii]ACM19778.1 4-amino-5-hydroxymethyl-2-methylpyrimidine-phosphate kinase and thiamin-monophosphate synthase [Geotalea daltonii FRC-32]